MARRKKSRLYTRERGGETRYYADFRDVGGKREALKPPGETRATTDLAIAEKLLADRLRELERKRRRRTLLGVRRLAGRKEVAAHHLQQKAKSGQFAEAYLTNLELHYGRAVEHFGADRELNTIGVSDVRRWTTELRKVENGHGGTLSEKTVWDHLDSLSNLFRRAQDMEAVPPGYNPCASMMEKPKGNVSEAEYLEPAEVAIYLEAASTYKPPKDKHGISGEKMHAIVSTFALTGGRKSEVLGLLVEDVSFDRGTVTFRPNAHRRLKTRRSARTVPLWPQLRETLQRYVFGGPGPPSGLLFPSPRTGKMVTDLRKALDAIADRAQMRQTIRTRIFRHTYCSTRLQTYELVQRPGADGEMESTPVPVSLFTVAREMGHTSTRLIEERYGHLLVNRQARSDVVEYSVEQHEEELSHRLRALQTIA